MPTYDYKCDSCGYRFEEFQSMTAKPLSICPKCGKQVHRLISAGNGFLFKGSGFYITDYRSESYKKGMAQESKSTKPETKSKSSNVKPAKSATVSNMA